MLRKGVGVLVAAGIAGGGYSYFGKDDVLDDAARSAQIGDCLNLTGTSFNAASEAISCDDPGATYLVTATGGTCDKHEDEYTVTYTGVGTPSDVKVCLTVNAKKGDCFFVNPTMPGPMKKLPCKRSNVKVVAVKHKTANPKACPKKKDVYGVGNKTRGQLVCFTRV